MPTLSATPPKLLPISSKHEYERASWSGLFVAGGAAQPEPAVPSVRKRSESKDDCADSATDRSDRSIIPALLIHYRPGAVAVSGA